MPDISYINLQSPLTVKVEWKRNSAEPPLTLSISALMLNQRTGLIDKLEDFVFYGSKMSNDGILSEDKSIKCDPVDFKKGFGTEGVYKMSIDLKKVKVDVDKIRIVVSINPKVEDYPQIGFDTLLTTQFTIEDSAGVSYSCDLAKDSDSGCRCIDIGLVKRWGDNWRFEEEMELTLGGLELVYNEYMCDSIINSNPFSKIGDLSIIENKYKETIKNTIISKDGTKNIIERTVEVISTKIGQLTGKEEQQKPWKKHLPQKGSMTTVEMEPQKRGIGRKEKPWKKKVKTPDVPQETIPPVEQKNDKGDSKKKPWKRGKSVNVDKHYTDVVATKDVTKTGMAEKRKFPKVKRPNIEDENTTKEVINEPQQIKRKRKFPKVKKNS